MRSILGKLYQNVTSLKAVSFVAVSAIAVITPLLFSQQASALNFSINYLNANPTSQNLEINNTTTISVKAVLAKTGLLSFAQLVSQNASITATVTSGEISKDCLNWTTPTTATFNFVAGDTANVSFCYKGTVLGAQTISFTSSFPYGLGFAPLGGVKTPSTTANVLVRDTVAPVAPTGGLPTTTTTNNFNFVWNPVIDNGSPITEYQYQTSTNPSVSAGVLQAGLWRNWIDGNSAQHHLTTPLINSTGASDGIWYWQVRAVDAAGNVGPWSSVWTTVIDTTAPTGLENFSPADGAFITTANLTEVDWTDATDLISNPVSYYYQSSTSSDVNEVDGSFTTPVYTSDALDVSNILTPGTPEGVYYWHVRAVDSLGNSTPWTEPWKVTVDNTKPVITIRPAGESEQVDVTIEAGDVYIDQGATWTDGTEGPIDVAGEGETASNVDNMIPGEYTVVYSHTDSAGNTGTATRNVTVVDTTKPVVTLKGSDQITLENGAIYIEQGASWTDLVDGKGDVTDIAGNVNTKIAGTYTITYSYMDKAGNTGTATRKVTVKDAPVVIVPLAIIKTATTKTFSSAADSNGEVMGDSTTSDTTGSVKAASDTSGNSTGSTNSDSSTPSIFGLAWYWWVLILAAIAGLWWFLFGRRKKEDEE